MLISINYSLAQLDSSNIIIDNVLDNIIDESDNETDNSELTEILEELTNNPVDINKADLIELTKIPGVDNITAQKIIDHRNKFGKYYSTNELYTIETFDKNLVEQITPFIKTDDDNSLINSEKSGSFFNNSKFIVRNRVTSDLQTRKGFLDNKYVGSKLKSYNRFIYKYKENYQMGILAEKDPGENSFTDFLSYHLQIKNFGFIKNFVAGDFVLEFGQGLALWSPFGFSKGSDAIYSTKKYSRYLKPYTSSSEYRFFRGIATTINIFNNFNITVFYSSNHLDATIDSSTLEITSLGQTGFHRFDTEINKKNSVNSKIKGSILDYSFLGRYTIGFIYYNNSFDKDFKSESVYGIKGNNFNYTSLYYDANFSKINIFGEFTYDGIAVASINGIKLFVTNNFSFVTSIRSYPRNYNNLYGFGFSERSGKINNEVGLYSGIKWKLPIGVLDFYFDNFKFPYQTSENSLSSEGNEFLINFLFTPFKGWQNKLRYKYENKEVTALINTNETIVKRLKQNIRVEFISEISKSLSLKTRVEYNHFFIKDTQIKEKGYLVFQDLKYTLNNYLYFYGRITFFQTDSFNSAIYEYENDLLGVMPNIALFGQGIRTYLIIKYRPWNYLSVSAKYSETYKPQEKYLSSGENEIDGNIDNRISFQIDFNF